jgi:3-hydroxyisobutyrate dehydrogenase-like beta-hydroxyacid dehydrogenase
MMTVGIVGVGQMGAPMAKNLLEAGYSVNVYDINEQQMDRLALAGAKKTANGRDLAARSDVVMTVLTWPKVVEEAVLGKDGVLDGLQRGAILIECSSTDHETSIRIGEKVEAAGRRYVEVALRGRNHLVESKELRFLTAGKRETVQECEPILLAIGKKALYTGDLGSAKLLKIAGAMLNAAETAVTWEVLAWCLQNGIAREGFLAILEERDPRRVGHIAEILNGKLETSPSWVAKDLYHGVKIAGAKEIPTPILSAVNALTNIAQSQNEKGYRYSEMLWKFYERMLRESKGPPSNPA